MLLRYRLLGGVGALLLIAGAIAASSGTGGAETVKGAVSDTITFSGQLFTVHAPTETTNGTGSLIATSCILKVKGVPGTATCTLSGTASLTLDGGFLTGTITSSDGVITFEEEFEFTGPSSGIGWGEAGVFQFGSFTPAGLTSSFTTSPTGVPSILNTKGTIVINGSPIGPGTTIGD
jgi:hypothetical protein